MYAPHDIDQAPAHRGRCARRYGMKRIFGVDENYQRIGFVGNSGHALGIGFIHFGADKQMGPVGLPLIYLQIATWGLIVFPPEIKKHREKFVGRIGVDPPDAGLAPRRCVDADMAIERDLAINPIWIVAHARCEFPQRPTKPCFQSGISCFYFRPHKCQKFLKKCV